MSFSTGYSLYQQSQILSKVRDVATKEDMMEGMGEEKVGRSKSWNRKKRREGEVMGKHITGDVYRQHEIYYWSKCQNSI